MKLGLALDLGSGLRLALAGLFLLVGSLALLKPPTYSFWKLSIVVTEGGHFAVIPLLAMAVWSFNIGGLSRVAGFLFLASAGLFAFTSLRAIKVAAHLEKEFVATWGGSSSVPLRTDGVTKTLPLPPSGFFQRQHILSLADLYKGIVVPSHSPKTLVYVTKDSRDLKLDFYPALGSKALAPCVVVVHGGGWDGGARSQLPDLNAFLAAEGYAIASIEYRLAPKHVYPAPVEDVADAMQYLRNHAQELGIDTARFVLLGRSAGGQIALQAAYTLQDPAIKGVVAFYAPSDMVFGYSLPTNPLIMDSRLIMQQYLGGGYEEHPTPYVASSPIEHVGTSSPPTLLLHGRPDVLVSYQHTVRMRAKMESLGVKHFIVDVPWAAHGFDYVFRGPGSQISLYFIERFLAKVSQ